MSNAAQLAQLLILRDESAEGSQDVPSQNAFARETRPGFFPVMLASLEHSLPHLAKGRATAGGLGKVVDLIARKHPSDILLVHPMLKEEDGKLQYGQPYEEQMPLRLLIEGEHYNVRVYRFVPPDHPRIADVHVEFLMLSHEIFQSRTLDGIYPNPLSRRAVLKFFSLWNQAVGALLARHKPRVFHCPDFHSAIAPWYALPEHPDLRILLVLHNAEYQGTISTDMIFGRRLAAIASLFNLPPQMVKDHLVLDGRFNMLKAAVDFVMEKQDGRGVCAVSHWYAAECHANYGVLWPLPSIQGLDNPMLEEERAVVKGDINQAKAEAKLRIQRRFGLEENPNARLFVSLGRLVRQKGVDLIADVAGWLLSEHADSQLILVGPIGDGFGHYAASRLQQLDAHGQYHGRLYVNIQFMRDPEALKDMKLGADFCLMPSRDEPFGYVDIEFAWHGALLVGAQAGGLGKVPGFYFLAQNRENLGRLRRELRSAVSQAMRAPRSQLESMAQAAVCCSFPLEHWQRRLAGAYGTVTEGVPTLLQREQSEQSLATLGNSCSQDDAGQGLRLVAAPPGSSIEFDESPGRGSGTKTFRPYPDAADAVLLSPVRDGAVQASQFPGAAPVSIVESAVGEEYHHVNASFAQSAAGPEFMTQELDEDELAERVKQKVHDHQWGIDEILESVGADVDFEREGSPMARWLLGRTCGVQRVHIVVALGYVASPVAEFLTFLTATEWGLRGGETVPRFAQRLFGQKIDPPILNMLLFAINALAFSVAAPFWAVLSRFFQPRRIMAVSLLLQVPLLLTLWPMYPSFELACLLVFAHGLVTASSFLFLVFNFMMSIKADMSNYAIRLGTLEMLRYVVNWLLSGYIFLASPSSLRGTKQQPIPTKFALLLLPIGLLMLLLTLIPGVLLLFAPGPYREDRFPGWNLELLFKRRSFVLLFFSECVGNLALFPGTCYISWWLSNGWSSIELSSLSVLFAFLLAFGTFLWAAALSRASIHGFSFLVGVAVMLAPGMMLRSIVQDEVATITSLGRSEAAMVIGVFSLFLEGVRSSALWTAKIRILNSRWRLLSYGTVLQSCSHFCAFLSPIVCEFLARRHGVTFITRNQKELADAMIMSVVPLGLVQFLLQVIIAPFIKKDMGISVGAERSSRSLLRKFRKGTSVFALATFTATGIALVVLMGIFLKIQMPVDRIARCELPHATNCSVLADEVDAQEATLGQHYGLNRFGQNTTGLSNCLSRMRAVGGDTFRFWQFGRCQVQMCGSASALQNGRSAGEGEGPLQTYDLWSRYCDMSRPNLIAVHLFEWSWQDVGSECENYLGPAGFNAVQVSPPSEHILGDSWATRYQPVSYKLESRGGSTDDFVSMVSRCRSAGVNIMVDVVLNHMAGPFVFSPEKDRGKACGQHEDTPKSSTAKCLGWDNTEYGNREYLNGRKGLDWYDRSMFHHYPDNEHANCGLPPWTNNKRLCDMYGLPDLNTEDKNVQKQLRAYLFELLETGVTMIRVDAAMNIYPESLAQVVLALPWEYIVQEYYPDMFEDKENREKATSIGSATDFTFGQRVAESLFDGNAGSWYNRSRQLGELLQLQREGFPDCRYRICESPVPSDRALLFLDNHDQQRERWKPEVKGQPPSTPVCYWDGRDIGSCRPIYKHGQVYALAQLYMLAWPYGADRRSSVRLMSSYGFHEFNEGPPGVGRDSLRDKAASPVVCRSAPTTSPVTDAYDNDTAKPWVCEHRWQGVSGTIRFRQFSNGSAEVHSTWDDGDGHIGFSLGHVGFAAFSRGYNWYTKQGSHAAISLAGKSTGLPTGCYCNLADEPGAVPDPQNWTGRCAGPTILVRNRTIVNAQLASGAAVILHALYPAEAGLCAIGASLIDKVVVA
ncbi:mok11 [Symbiodinium natans]|uniref:alpha-amylase n=1 Tax=Symbiodinium natans TaxID=878477 RepID=A0A812KMG3_9DINO|nr:mok11 [Symbiodinium natans]